MPTYRLVWRSLHTGNVVHTNDTYTDLDCAKNVANQHNIRDLYSIYWWVETC